MSKLREAVEALLTHIDKCAGSPRMGCVFADDPAVLAVRSALSSDDEGDLEAAAKEYKRRRTRLFIDDGTQAQSDAKAIIAAARGKHDRQG